MKRQVLSILATLVLMIPVGAAAGFAEERLEAHVPFSFSIGGKELPAGDYNFEMLSPNYWGIRNQAGGGSALTIVSPYKSNPTLDQGKVIFKQYRNQYFLSQISREGITVSVPRSKLERELARNGMTSTNVAIAARQ